MSAQIRPPYRKRPTSDAQIQHVALELARAYWRGRLKHGSTYEEGRALDAAIEAAAQQDMPAFLEKAAWVLNELPPLRKK